MHAIWRIIEMWTDPEDQGTLWRYQSALSGFVYAGLGVEAIRTALGLRSG